MIESPLLQKMLAQRIHDLILAVLKDRFKTVPRDVTKHLCDILDEKKLTALNIFAGKCPNMEAFRDALLA